MARIAPPLLVVLVACTPEPKALPVLGELPAFALTDQDGQSYGTENLRGDAWVANFIFTRCPTVCPLFTAKMAGVQKRTDDLGTRLRSVSFSVDPDYDTPERLLAYAGEYKANPARWRFLTGELPQVKEVVIQGLKQAMGGHAEGNFAGIFHGSHFVLVDSNLKIRGYYDANDTDAVDRLVSDARDLLDSKS